MIIIKVPLETTIGKVLKNVHEETVPGGQPDMGAGSKIDCGLLIKIGGSSNNKSFTEKVSKVIKCNVHMVN